MARKLLRVVSGVARGLGDASAMLRCIRAARVRVKI